MTLEVGDKVKTIDEYNTIYRESTIGIVTRVQSNDFIIISRDGLPIIQIHKNWLMKIDE